MALHRMKMRDERPDDRTYEVASSDINKYAKPYALFISAGNDGRNTCIQIERISKGFLFRKVYEPIISRGTISENIL
ncbi:MAG: hypothetical protein GY860_09715, partial [Desulfobacteraceae bacterium]|nr:hypothetical protein [Desulfobacteraceae bacterium]